MTDIISAERPVRCYRQRKFPIRMILIHATRGHTKLAFQDDATLNHFGNPPINPASPYWGATADALISADEDLVYEFVPDVAKYHSAWSAGYGLRGVMYEHGADEHSLSIEVASRVDGDYTDETIRRLAWYINKKLDDLGLRSTIPLVRLPTWTQIKGSYVPVGFIGHEDTANGKKSGKTDPGPKFPWGTLFRYIAASNKPDVLPKFTTSDAEVLWWDAWAREHGQTRPANLDVTVLDVDDRGRKHIEAYIP